MAPRIELQVLLETILGSTQVYFQPKTNTKISYPCIVYQRDTARTEFADNGPYSYTQRYQLTVITKEPDSDVLAKVQGLPLCVPTTFFVADNLNHDVFTIYF